MSIHYKDYRWKEGIPRGLGRTDAIGTTYKIPMDPYRKRISVEEYRDGAFQRVIYDSALINFRHLKPEHQTAWQQIREGSRIFIFDQDDRLVFIEEYTFEGELCRKTKTTSPHGVLLCTQELNYEALGDTFNGTILYDSSGRTVLLKKYSIDEPSGQFLELLEENADIQESLPLGSS